MFSGNVTAPRYKCGAGHEMHHLSCPTRRYNSVILALVWLLRSVCTSEPLVPGRKAEHCATSPHCIMVLLLCSLGLLSLLLSSTTPWPIAPGNGVVSCRPGVSFLRDCGNECTCSADGQSAQCTARACPKDFETSMRDEVDRVYARMDQLQQEGNGPVFTCVPRSGRKINSYGGTCYCATNGEMEICSQHPNSPWGT